MNDTNKKNICKDIGLEYGFINHKIIIRSFLLKYFTEDELKYTNSEDNK